MPVTISKLLVAGRGEIALRIIRTAHELDVGTVAVYSDPDAAEPFVAAADEAVRLPGAAPAQTYLRGDLIIAAARATGAQAVHPGYGFLSENAAFARACQQAGLIFVGPPPAAIEAMGSKIAARELMAAAGVPVLPGAVAGTGDGADALASAAAQVGYPLLVKAAYGGGGRGMRRVAGPGELAAAVASASREAESAFGDGTVFAERLVERPRHIEVQIFGDSHGTVAHLFERECSVQRRYQKIIEEAPSPVVDDELRARLTTAAVAAGQAIGYTGAGTVEFVLAEATGEFWFLEMNTRLQVEHPVTELVTGLDLVAVQLAVAEGQPLPPEVTAARLTGHAVEARLYAEDPAAGFRPATGTLDRFAVPALPGVRVDAGVTGGSVIGPYYDPMLAKVIAHGATRDQACRLLARALSRAQLHGVTTNRDLLTGILREPEFRAGRADTGYLSRHDPSALAAPPAGDLAVTVHAVAAALAGAAARRAAARVLPAIPAGWRNVPSQDQLTTFSWAGQELAVRYQVGRGGERAAVNGRPLPGLIVHSAAPDAVDLTVAGVRRTVSVHLADGTAYTDSPLGASVLAEVPRFAEPGALAEPGSLLAPLPGTVVRAVAAGERVGAGDPVVVIEAMKMEHAVRAPAAGVIAEACVQAGQAVAAGALLARIEPDGEAAAGGATT
ncbi:MAG: ATP-grasp domain-containing protein [Nocardiopsaceae bacterium]|jgi:acetyl/propionyl-CoA carboxylase alpha subunit|nr:ATP-grasp domain-containing protein [Nocardiopsaceae bacterium]